MSTTPLVQRGPADQSLVSAMLDPAFYPKPPARVMHLETHISDVFFANDLVYKIKKPVRFSFLDFSTLARRRHFLQEELRLNRRLAPSVYLGVMPISLDESGWRLGGWTKPVEYTLVMRRLPDKQMLPFLLETGQVTAQMMVDLATLLEKFHADAKIVRDIDPKAYLADIEARWNENLAWLKSHLCATEQATWRRIESFGTGFMAAHGDLLARRAAEGRVRDVHGDLHAEHICFAPEGIQIFDCIEFDANLRRCDLASEIGFLSMDLRVRGGKSLVERFLGSYGRQVGDAEMRQLLPFFECYRALVRAKVHTLRSIDWNDEAARYFRFAGQVAWRQIKPFILIVCGLTGSGKSTLSRLLTDRIGLAVINSDGLRKRLAGFTDRPPALFNEGLYSAAMTGKTYGAMARQAERQIAKGSGAILDATFMLRAQREKFIRLAEKYGVPLLVVHCSAGERAIEERLRQRAARGTDISDGRWEIYVEQKSTAEPVEEIASSQYLELNTDSAPEKLASLCEEFLLWRLGP